MKNSRSYLKRIHKVQVSLNRYLIKLGYITHNTSKKDIVRLFSTYPLIDKKPFKPEGNKNLQLLEIANKLWGTKIPVEKTAKKKRKLDAVCSDEFLQSYAWRKVRYEILKLHGRRCMCCGRTPGDNRQVHVDHIKPRRKHPELALDPSNLQILCNECNHGKGNWDETDWRPKICAYCNQPVSKDCSPGKPCRPRSSTLE